MASGSTKGNPAHRLMVLEKKAEITDDRLNHIERSITAVSLQGDSSAVKLFNLMMGQFELMRLAFEAIGAPPEVLAIIDKLTPQPPDAEEEAEDEYAGRRNANSEPIPTEDASTEADPEGGPG